LNFIMEESLREKEETWDVLILQPKKSKSEDQGRYKETQIYG